jgi:sec-independent protein translocase protein TatB
MFDFAWSEIMLIGVVALIAIGPKDLPVAMKAITDIIKKARRMASEFQGHVDEMMREANLEEVRQQINEIRNFDLKGTVERAVDPDGTLRDTFTSNPLEPGKDFSNDAPSGPQPVMEEPSVPAGGEEPSVAAAGPPPDYPAFIPPEFATRCTPPPAFVPPGMMAPISWYSTSSRA